MAALMKELGLDKLTAAERMQLVDELLESVAESPPPLSEAMKDYLDRRLEAIKHDPLAGTPYEEVMARLRGKR
jgi:putative addiction module component (TIGR02574 family)